MKADLYNATGAVTGSIEISDGVFDVRWNGDLMHQVLCSYEGNERKIVAHAKGRGEVSGGGKKPWKQKGTGRARAGSTRSPIWRKGGVTHGPLKDKEYSLVLPRKMAKKAIGIALSQKLREKEVKFVEGVEFQNAKTKNATQVLAPFVSMRKNNQLLVVIPEKQENLKRSLKNLKSVDWALANDLNAKKVITHKNVLIFKESLPAIEKHYNAA